MFAAAALNIGKDSLTRWSVSIGKFFRQIRNMRMHCTSSACSALQGYNNLGSG
jgi:hypothetical protein